MANFTNVFSPALTINQRVTAAELNQLDGDHVLSLNRAGGDIIGVVNVDAGAVFNILSSGLVEFQSGALITDLGATWNVQGDFTVASPGSIALATGAALYGEVGSYVNLYGTVNFEATSAVTVLGGLTILGGTATFATGTTLQMAAGSQTNIVNTTASNFTVTNFPTFATAQDKTLTTSFAEGLPGPCTAGGNGFNYWAANANSVGSVTNYDTNRTDVNYWYLPLKVHNGGTLSDVFVSYQLNNASGPVPSNPVTFNIFRVNNSSGVVESLLGGAVSLPGSAYSSTARQAFTITCSTNNVIETYQFSYHLQLIDDHGTNSITNNTFIQAITYHTNITTTAWGN